LPKPLHHLLPDFDARAYNGINMADDHSGALLEVMNDRLAAILEGQAAMSEIPQRLTNIEDRLTEVQSDVKVIKAAVTDQSTQLADHETRISSLEPAA
jgi:septal ring factor EnvC (AmiA/AmiB activator)